MATKLRPDHSYADGTAASATGPVLEARKLSVGYGPIPVLREIDLPCHRAKSSRCSA